jgi:hypothetical protein
MHTTPSRARILLATVTVALLAVWTGASASASDPSGERLVGHGLHGAAIEPAYNADSGDLMYLLTPIGAPLPAKANEHAQSPLYMVVYPPGYEGTLNCMGVPGNCPDHAGEAAGIATDAEPSVYGTNPMAVPGHDHVADPPGAPDWNVAWDVIEVVFTDGDHVTHLTTDAGIQAAVTAGYAREIPLGFAFNCSVVSPSVYARGVPVTG